MAKFEVRAQAILLVGDRILLARHVKRSERYVVLPGGHVEAGETLEEALARELEEEVGVRPTAASLFSVSEFLMRRRQVIDVVFRVHAFQGRPRLGPVPGELTDRRLEAVELHRVAHLAKLPFRPAGLGAEIASAWARDCWDGSRYLGNLATARG